MTSMRRAVLWRLLGDPEAQQCELSQLEAGWRRDGTVVTVANGERLSSGIRLTWTGTGRPDRCWCRRRSDSRHQSRSA